MRQKFCSDCPEPEECWMGGCLSEMMKERLGIHDDFSDRFSGEAEDISGMKEEISFADIITKTEAEYAGPVTEDPFE